MLCSVYGIRWEIVHTEGCGSKHKKDKGADKAVCPHCNHKLCLSCNGLGHLGSCNGARKKEGEQLEKAIKDMGAKQCPISTALQV